jgi:hypothetical protein
MELSKSSLALDSAGLAQTDGHPRLSRCEKYLLAIFLFSLPLSNPFSDSSALARSVRARHFLAERRPNGLRFSLMRCDLERH